jgi:hypothetical protein
MLGYDYVAVPLQHVMFAIEARPDGATCPQHPEWAPLVRRLLDSGYRWVRTEWDSAIFEKLVDRSAPCPNRSAT